MLFTFLAVKFKYKFNFIQYFDCKGSYSKLREIKKGEDLNLFGPIKDKSKDEERFNFAMIILLQEFSFFRQFKFV